MLVLLALVSKNIFILDNILKKTNPKILNKKCELKQYLNYITSVNKNYLLNKNRPAENKQDTNPENVNPKRTILEANIRR